MTFKAVVSTYQFITKALDFQKKRLIKIKHVQYQEQVELKRI